MKVALRDMPCHRRLELGAAFVAQSVSGLPVRAALERPEEDPEAGRATADLDLYLEGDNVFARGRLSGWIEVACSRCVGTARLEIEEPLNVTFMPAAHMPGADPAGETDAADDESEAPTDADAEDVDLFPYRGEEVDLEPLLREQIILAVPYAPLCSESCRGLCPVCGIDRNTGSCTCDAAPADPRWSGLRNLNLKP
ncbi:MAG TPA: DUF177 domain-containing protein [Candidatus Acidoferrum sp.]|nr:DUF177 domain-containing protein [Candidatus Acidoferrum sp.]